MKTLLICLFLLASRQASAQYFSLKELLTIAETKYQGHFLGDVVASSHEGKFWRSKGFVGVRWRRTDPDIDENVFAYKLYSKAANTFLIFRGDAHGRLLEELIYRFRSPACVASLTKQLAAAGFVKLRHPTPPEDEDPNAIGTAHFSVYDAYFYNTRYTVTITGAVGPTGNDLRHYSVAIARDAAMQQMQEEINAVGE